MLTEERTKQQQPLIEEMGRRFDQEGNSHVTGRLLALF